MYIEGRLVARRQHVGHLKRNKTILLYKFPAQLRIIRIIIACVCVFGGTNLLCRTLLQPLVLLDGFAQAATTHVEM